MKTLRQMFTDKAIEFRLQSEDYILKTVSQMAYLDQEKRNSVMEQIVWFLKIKDSKKLQIKFNKIAGLVNDSQMQMLSKFQGTCEYCDAILNNNMCYNCDI